MNKRRTVLYIGVTSDISRRWFKHCHKQNPNSFSDRYNCNELVHIEEYTDIYEAQSREKRLKGWKRDKKLALIKE
jgi:putative endonuclease